LDSFREDLGCNILEAVLILYLILIPEELIIASGWLFGGVI
jgi:hypothetical protein